MKKFLILLLALVAIPALATVYTDATGDEFSGNANLDISGAEITNDVTTLSFKINIVGDIVATDWGKYMVGINSTTGGDTEHNGWNRPIGMSAGMDYWLGGWVDSGGGVQVWKWESNTWNQTTNYTPTITANAVTYTVNLSDLGLSPGNSFTFDIYSSGGNGSDGAIDALSTNSQTVSAWDEYYNSGSQVSSYTVPIPEPIIISLLMFSLGLFILRK